MPKPPVDRIVYALTNAMELYYRLIFIVGPIGSGKTAILQDLGNRIEAPILNVNLELSRRMLDMAEKQRSQRLPQTLRDMLANSSGDTAILDNLEILFDISLKQDPLRLLQGISRNRTVIASWSGSVEDEHLVYAAPGHPEHKRYEIKDFLVIDIQASG